MIFGIYGLYLLGVIAIFFILAVVALAVFKFSDDSQEQSNLAEAARDFNYDVTHWVN